MHRRCRVFKNGQDVVSVCGIMHSKVRNIIKRNLESLHQFRGAVDMDTPTGDSQLCLAN